MVARLGVLLAISHGSMSIADWANMLMYFSAYS
jgi:hypothetical protein